MTKPVMEALTFVVVFGVACACITALWRSYAPAQASKRRRTMELVQQYTPAIDVMLEYRDVHAFKTLRRVRISQALRGWAGHLYLLGFYESATKPRTFRLDRVVSFVSLDGEVLETRRFLNDRLGITDAPGASGCRPAGTRSPMRHNRAI